MPFLCFWSCFEDAIDGSGTADADFCVMQLSPDLSHSLSDPQKLFSPKDAEWVRKVPFAKEEFGIDGDCYFSDGPSFIKYKDGNLLLTLHYPNDRFKEHPCFWKVNAKDNI